MHAICTADVYYSVKRIVKHVFWDVRKVPRKMPDNGQASFWDLQAPFFFGFSEKNFWNLKLIFVN